MRSLLPILTVVASIAAMAAGVVFLAAISDFANRGCGMRPSDWTMTANCQDAASAAVISGLCAIMLGALALVMFRRRRA